MPRAGFRPDRGSHMPTQDNALGEPVNLPSTTKIVQALKGRDSDDQSQINRSSNAIPWRSSSARSSS